MRSARNATKKNLTEEEVDDGTRVREGGFVPVATVESTAKKQYAHGFGSQDRSQGNTGFAYSDFQADDGTGTIVNLSGTLRLVVYESSDLEQPKLFGSEYDLDELREAVNDSRTERPIVSVERRLALEDEVLAWELNVDSNQDGYTVSAADCDIQIPYSEWRD